MRTDRTDWVKFILDRFIWFIILGVFMFFSVKSENFLTPLLFALRAATLTFQQRGPSRC
jgi:hypothetical protein